MVLLVFQTLYPLISPHLHEQTAIDEWARIRRRKEIIADEVFNSWKRQQPPTTWSFLPPMEVVFGVWFFELIHSEESLTDKKIKAATKQVPQLYEEWFEKRRESLMKAMRSSPCRASVSLCRFDTAYPHSDLEFESAAAVFHCYGTLSSMSSAFLTFSL
jgi:hypothetical protein